MRNVTRQSMLCFRSMFQAAFSHISGFRYIRIIDQRVFRMSELNSWDMHKVSRYQKWLHSGFDHKTRMSGSGSAEINRSDSLNYHRSRHESREAFSVNGDNGVSRNELFPHVLRHRIDRVRYIHRCFFFRHHDTGFSEYRPVILHESLHMIGMTMCKENQADVIRRYSRLFNLREQCAISPLAVVNENRVKRSFHHVCIDRGR